MGIDLAYIELNMNGYGSHGLELARSQGLSTRFVCRRPEEYGKVDPDPTSLADGVVQVETYDVVHLLRAVELLAPDAVIGYDDYRLVQAAIVAAELGLPGPPPRGVLNCRFKDLTRRATAGIGYEVEHALVPLHSEVRRSPVGYPCVVKPTDDSASTGVRICRSDEDFVDAVNSAIDHATHARGYRCVDAVLVEEYVEGSEYSAELIWDSGREDWHLIGFTETVMGEPPFCQEAAHLFPAHLSPELAEKLASTVLEWLHAVGHRGTAAHVEFRLRPDGRPALMEINPRLGGGEIRRLIELTCGYDVVDLYQRLWRGLPVEPDSGSSRPGGYAAVRYLNPPSAGLVRHVAAGPDALPHVAASQISAIKAGGREVSSLSRLGWVITRSDDPETALSEAEHFHATTRFEYAS